MAVQRRFSVIETRRSRALLGVSVGLLGFVLLLSSHQGHHEHDELQEATDSTASPSQAWHEVIKSTWRKEWINLESYYSYTTGRDVAPASSYDPRLATGERPCDPFAQEGYLDYRLDANENVSWVPHDERCLPSLDWPRLLAVGDPWIDPGLDQERKDKLATPTPDTLEARASLEWLRGRTIFIQGDSVDRNALESFAFLTRRPFQQMSYFTRAPANLDPAMSNITAKSTRGIPRMLEFQALDFRILFNFFYGLDDQGRHSNAGDFHPPSLYEDRVDELMKPFIDIYTNGKGPDMIRFHSGMWDLVAVPSLPFGDTAHKDARFDEQHRPLHPDQIDWYTRRYMSALRKLRDTWPTIPIRTRLLHRIGGEKMRSLDKSDLRVQNMNQIARYAAKEMEMPYLDLEDILTGYHTGEMHPGLYPANALIAQSTIQSAFVDFTGV